MKTQAYDELKSLIVSGSIEPGSFLSERSLSVRLGMSKTPIRTALERLSMEGFVTISPQQGIVVREMSLHEISDQFQIRLALEGFVLRTIAGKLSAEQVAQLEGQLKLQKRAAQANDVARTAELDTEFHLMLCSFLGNAEIIRALCQLRDRIARVILRVFKESSLARLQENLQEHRAIADAVIRGKRELAVELLERHLEYGKQSLLSRSRP